jgi:hypothetical protein
MKNSEREEFLSQNPDVEQQLSSFSIGDPVRLGLKKTEGGFRDVLKQIKKQNRGSTIDSGNLGQI